MSDEHMGDRRTALGWLAGGGVVAAVALAPGRGQAVGQEVDLKKVPKPVMDAATRMLPKATWHAAVRVEDGKNVAYDLDGSDGKDRDVTIMITAEGKVVEWETKLKDPANVPEKVLKAVKDTWKQFTPTEVHHIRQGKDLRTPTDGDHVYDLRGTVGKGRHVHFQVSAEGEIHESVVEVPLEKVPKEVLDALKKARPNFEYETAYAIRDDKVLVGYHFESKGAKGRDHTISVTPDGKQVEVIE